MAAIDWPHPRVNIDNQNEKSDHKMPKTELSQMLLKQCEQDGEKCFQIAFYGQLNVSVRLSPSRLLSPRTGSDESK